MFTCLFLLVFQILTWTSLFIDFSLRESHRICNASTIALVRNDTVVLVVSHFVKCSLGALNIFDVIARIFKLGMCNLNSVCYTIINLNQNIQ